MSSETSTDINTSIDRLSNPNWRLRQIAAEQLKELDLKKAKSALEKLKEVASKDEQWNVRISALDAIFEIEQDKPTLVKVLSDRLDIEQEENWQVRQKAAESLGLLGVDAKGALSSLKDCESQDKDWDVKAASRMAIAKIENKPETEILEKLCEDLDSDDMVQNNLYILLLWK